MKTVYLCEGPKKTSHQPRLKEGFCFLCLCKMVQLHYMPWHALDVAWGDGHTQALATWGPVHYMPWHALDVARGDGRTQAPATRGPGAAGQRPELPTSEQPGLQCVQPWHTPCPPGAQPSQQRAAGNPQASLGQPGAGRQGRGASGGPRVNSAPGRTSPGSLEDRRLG